MNLQILLHFYLISLLFILFFFGVALIQKKTETLIRSLTVLLLLQIISLAIWQGTLGFTIFISVLFILSLYEVSQHYETNHLWLALVSIPLFVIGFYSNQQFVELAALWLIPISVLTFTGAKETIQSPSYLFGFSLCFLLPCSIFLVKILSINGGAILSIFLLLQFNDAFGYLFGKQFGKTKLFPTISPNKTGEGYLFGGIGIIMGIILLHTYIPVLSPDTYYKDIILFGLILILGNLGDLMLSALKRKLEIKDFSNILPGHGGILDRFDNIFFVAPIFYVLLNHNLIL